MSYMVPEAEAAESQAISNNALYKTYTNTLKIEKLFLSYDISLQYPADWFLEEINKIGGKYTATELVSITNPAENVFIWIDLVPWLSETDAASGYWNTSSSKLSWCDSKTFQSDGFVCRDMIFAKIGDHGAYASLDEYNGIQGFDNKLTITKYGKKQYHVLTSYTLDYEDGNIHEIKYYSALITNINSSWDVRVYTSSNHWYQYKHDIYSIIDSIQTISNNVKSNENGFLRLSSNVYELPKAGASNMYAMMAAVDVFGKFSGEKVGSIIMKVTKPDGKIDQENIRISKDSPSFNYPYKIKSDFPIGEYQITVSAPGDIQLGPISFTVIAADPENQICGGAGWENLAILGGDMPNAGYCRTINTPVLEKQVEDTDTPDSEIPKTPELVRQYDGEPKVTASIFSPFAFSFANARVVDEFGASVSEVTVDKQIQIVADITNGLDKEQSFVYILLVQEENNMGDDVAMKWTEGSLGYLEEVYPALSWTPSAPGSYFVTLAVYPSMGNTSALAPQQTINIDVLPKTVEPVTAIPEWIKNNAGWWAEGQIDDSSFLQGIQFLIKEGIMVIPPTETSSSSGSEGVPAWVKNNAGWWADGQIDDNSFVSGIQYLVKVGIIKVG